jgi:hypothetical protein
MTYKPDTDFRKLHVCVCHEGSRACRPRHGAMLIAHIAWGCDCTCEPLRSTRTRLASTLRCGVISTAHDQFAWKGLQRLRVSDHRTLVSSRPMS